MDDRGGQRQEWREAMTQFEVFRRQPPAGAHEPTVTVQRHGLLTLNQAAYAELGAPDAVQLLYAHRERLIGLRAAGAKTPDAYRVRKPSVGPGFLVSGRAYTNHYRIPTDIARRYRAVMINGILTVHLGDVLKERRRSSVQAKPTTDRRTDTLEEPWEREEGL
jgi:tartrate dehydratase beta subunit/fumarate hydratase class I family protein